MAKLTNLVRACFVVLVAMSIVGCPGKDKQDKDKSSTSSTKQPIYVVGTISSEILAQQFIEDEASATTTYSQPMIVEGVVVKVVLDEVPIALHLKGGKTKDGKEANVVCWFANSAKDKLGNIKVGERLSIKSDEGAFMSKGKIAMQQCELVE